MHSDGIWRYSEESMEVTTSGVGIVGGNKRVCDVHNELNPKEEVDSNGKVIAFVPQMLMALKDVRMYFRGRGHEVSREQAKYAVEDLLKNLGI